MIGTNDTGQRRVPMAKWTEVKAARVAPAHVRDFQRDGYAVVRGVFGAARSCRGSWRHSIAYGGTGLVHPKSFRHGNVFSVSPMTSVWGASSATCSGPPTSIRCWTGSARICAFWRSSSRCSATISSRSSISCTGSRRAPPWPNLAPSGHPLPPAAFRVPGAGRELCADGYRDRSAPKRERRDARLPR